MPPQSSPPPFVPPPAAKQPRFQFSLRAQLIAVTAVAVLLGFYVVAPQIFLALFGSFVSWLLPAPLLAGAIYGGGNVRTFSIGALIPWLTVWAAGGHPFFYGALYGQPNYEAWMPVAAAALTVFTSGACGFLVVLSRRWLERHGMTDGS